MENFDALFYRDPYLRTFEAQVLSCEKGKQGWEIVLDRSAFYYEGGGQPADEGTLSVQAAETGAARAVRVRDVRRRAGVAVHMTDGPLPVGARVTGELDWARRFAHMQGHTGEHIFSGILHRRYGCENVGFHLGERIRVDFDRPLTWTQVTAAETEANELIWANVPVRELFPTEEERAALSYRSKIPLSGKVRLIDIPGGDCCACCGTHVRRTGEIGLIKILSLMNYKGGVRMEMVCGSRALAYVQQLQDGNTAIYQALSAKPEETAAAVARLLLDLQAEKQRAAAATGKYLAARCAQLTGNQALLIDFEEDLAPADARRLADLLVKQGAGVAAVLSSEGAGQPRRAARAAQATGEAGAAAPVYHYAIAAQTAQAGGKAAPMSAVNLRDMAKQLNAALSGRGGGAPELIQGTFSASEERIRAVLTKIFAAQVP